MQKIRPDFFQAKLIYGEEPLWILNVIEDDCCFLGVYIWGSTRCNILFTLGLFPNYFSLKSLSLSLKSHMNVLCALKLNELWNTSLLFDLNYKYIMGASLLALAKSIYYFLQTPINRINFVWTLDSTLLAYFTFNFPCFRLSEDHSESPR